MKKTVMILSALALASLAPAGQALADDTQRVLRVSKGVCPDFKADLVAWAGKTEGRGAYAVPIAPKDASFDCDNPGPIVPTGFSFGFDEQKAADLLAIKECTARMPEGYRGCVVVARSYPR